MSDSNELAWIATRSMRGPAHGRYAARLSQVPSAALINLLAQACVELPDWRRRVDELMAQWSPLPAFATSEVLLSHDFLTTILATLGAECASAASVCTTWRAAWNASLGQRRILHGLDVLILDGLDMTRPLLHPPPRKRC